MRQSILWHKLSFSSYSVVAWPDQTVEKVEASTTATHKVLPSLKSHANNFQHQQVTACLTVDSGSKMYKHNIKIDNCVAEEMDRRSLTCDDTMKNEHLTVNS